jgi:hypothetical protein
MTEEEIAESIKAINEQLEASTKQLETLKKRQQYLATKRKEAESAKGGNKIGFYAAKTCREAIDVIRMVAGQLDVDNQTEEDVLRSFSLINKNSWCAIKALERDATERGEE